MVNHKKTTDDLVNEIKSSREIEGFFNRNEAEFAEENLAEYIEYIMTKKGLQKSKVCCKKRS